MGLLQIQDIEMVDRLNQQIQHENHEESELDSLGLIDEVRSALKLGHVYCNSAIYGHNVLHSTLTLSQTVVVKNIVVVFLVAKYSNKQGSNVNSLDTQMEKEVTLRVENAELLAPPLPLSAGPLFDIVVFCKDCVARRILI